MLKNSQTAIMKKDLNGLITNKQLIPALIIVPIVFALVFPTIIIMTVHFAPEEVNQIQKMFALLPTGAQSGNAELELIGLIINYIMPIFFMIIPIMAASIMAASSFVGEKEKRTLETLLYSPLTLREIFQSKIFASFMLSMIVTFSSFIIMLLAVQLEVFLIVGSLLPLKINWLITMLLVSPAVTLISITLIVRGSAKSQSMEEAQQKAVFLVLPVLALVVGQFTGVILINAWLLFALGVVCALIAWVLMKGGMHKFDYETILK